ncbi:hypothetical protein EMGBS15_14640 [Filimonas sp.]|jgi:hypothetical protein|nr:hypothetical protein EMGBS15_14640 [Filimonas sp.]
MNPRVVTVIPHENYSLHILFDNNEWRVFDVKPYLERGIFKQLKNQDLFNTVVVNDGTVLWQNEADFCPDTLYELSIVLNELSEQNKR